jgi:uncharacterized cupredoxin-like copper-binding protein
MNKTNKPVPAIAISVVALALALAGCGSDDTTSSNSSSASGGGATGKSAFGASGAQGATPRSGQTLTAQLDEWRITTKEEIVKSGKVKVTANNIGASAHELVLLKTDKPADDLGRKSEVSEKDSVGEVPTVAGGASRSVTLDLEPGNYALICNLPGHYVQGMNTSLTVK